MNKYSATFKCDNCGHTSDNWHKGRCPYCGSHYGEWHPTGTMWVWPVADRPEVWHDARMPITERPPKKDCYVVALVEMNEVYYDEAGNKMKEENTVAMSCGCWIEQRNQFFLDPRCDWEYPHWYSWGLPMISAYAPGINDDIDGKEVSSVLTENVVAWLEIDDLSALGERLTSEEFNA